VDRVDERADARVLREQPGRVDRATSSSEYRPSSLATMPARKAAWSMRPDS